MATTYASTTKAINALIKIEEAEVGYLEKATNANLDSKTANAGFNNFTKYWRDINDWGLFKYQSGWAGGPDWSWCAGLQTWCFVKAFGEDAALKLLLHLPFISCYQMGLKAKAAGQLKDDPKVGDIVLFWSKSKNFYHTAIVYKVDSTYVYTIEGNTSAGSTVVANGGGVAKKKYAIASMKSSGHKFFRPDYSIVVKKETVTTKMSDSTKDTTTTKSTTTVKYTVNTKKDPLCCREKASSSSTVLGTFAKGTTVTLVKKGKTWSKVKGKATSGKTITGYCANSYLKEKK